MWMMNMHVRTALSLIVLGALVAQSNASFDSHGQRFLPDDAERDNNPKRAGPPPGRISSRYEGSTPARTPSRVPPPRIGGQVYQAGFTANTDPRESSNLKNSIRRVNRGEQRAMAPEAGWERASMKKRHASEDRKRDFLLRSGSAIDKPTLAPSPAEEIDHLLPPTTYDLVMESDRTPYVSPYDVKKLKKRKAAPMKEAKGDLRKFLAMMKLSSREKSSSRQEERNEAYDGGSLAATKQ